MCPIYWIFVLNLFFFNLFELFSSILTSTQFLFLVFFQFIFDFFVTYLSFIRLIICSLILTWDCKAGESHSDSEATDCTEGIAGVGHEQ